MADTRVIYYLNIKAPYLNFNAATAREGCVSRHAPMKNYFGGQLERRHFEFETI
jgi:hypothetical protein